MTIPIPARSHRDRDATTFLGQDARILDGPARAFNWALRQRVKYPVCADTGQGMGHHWHPPFIPPEREGACALGRNECPGAPAHPNSLDTPRRDSLQSANGTVETMGIQGFIRKSDPSIQRIALVYLPASEDYPFSFMPEHFQKRPGLGLRYLVAALKANGYKVDLFDCLFDSARARTLADELNAGRYDLIGFSATHASIGRVKSVVSGLDREFYAGRLLVGGPASSQLDQVFDAGADVGVIGEADETIISLVRAYEGVTGFDEVKGIAFHDESGTMVTTPPATIVAPTSLPIPDWTDFDPGSGDLLEIAMKRPYYVVMASRGCPYHCAYCVTWKYWNGKYRGRPVEQVLDEVEFLIRKQGAQYIRFLDDVFAMRLDWLEAFCEGIHKRGLKFSWGITLHPLTFGAGRQRAFELLKAAGCEVVNYGAQSANPTVLKSIGRSADEPDALREAIPMANAMGFATVLTYIFGLPGETRETIRSNDEFVASVRPTLVDFHPLDYLPGSVLVDSMPVECRSTLTQAELSELCREAFVEYYGRRGGAFRAAWFILRNNPIWLGYAARTAGDLIGLATRHLASKLVGSHRASAKGSPGHA